MTLLFNNKLISACDEHLLSSPDLRFEKSYSRQRNRDKRPKEEDDEIWKDESWACKMLLRGYW